MNNLPERLSTMPLEQGRCETEYGQILTNIKAEIGAAGYEITESNIEKPWGAYYRIDSVQADEFVDNFFPELSPEEARLGVTDAELSPKFLVVLPGQRLSWQYHDRRAERWRFLTPGAYRRSLDDSQGERTEATIDEVVQFARGERHRLEGNPEGLVIVAEIWQHTDITHPSDEDDIVRLADDYSR